MKSEPRNPKSERSPKPEIRGHRIVAAFTEASQSRISAFGFLSDLGLRISVILTALVLAGCTSATHHANSSCCATNIEVGSAFTDKSLYQLDSTWTNDSGKPVKFGALQGRVQVVVMFFASCTYACPIIVHDMQRIEAALPETVRANTGFTLITIDPERDTTEALHSYRSIHKLAANRWTLLHGKPDDTLELAALLGVKFKREASGQFAHSNLITVLNDRGEIIHQQVGLNQAIEPTVQAIKRAVGQALNHASR